MTRGGMKEYLDAIRIRYLDGDRNEKSWILDEAERVTNLHRKALIRALRAQPRGTVRGKVGRPRRYSLEAVAALKTLWEASDRVCAKRLQLFLHELKEVLEQEVRDQVCATSAATIDRLLLPHRQGELRRPFSTTKPETFLKAAIPTVVEGPANGKGSPTPDCAAGKGAVQQTGAARYPVKSACFQGGLMSVKTPA